MRLRAMIRVNGKWQVETPEDILQWMWKRDGEDALIIDDSTEPKTYYTATEELLTECEKSGKQVAMFYGLGRKLWDEEQSRGNEPA